MAATGQATPPCADPVDLAAATPFPEEADVTVQIYRGRGRRNWRVRLVAGNGRILAVSEGYYSHWNARRAARRMFPSHPATTVPE